MACKVFWTVQSVKRAKISDVNSNLFMKPEFKSWYLLKYFGNIYSYNRKFEIHLFGFSANSEVAW